ncbi:hypothetical protein MCQ_00494 [Candidatus Bartonella washoeensis Sb944nv]|uniref:Uncharacterized protein n=1 Tax=Candidatus Bartonella washoeensis Sb944nv TaxID=1094563 RepID=J1J9K0_9HYPH|nr:hypothetical protein [Bartonella washoeensis]EJF80570.1 hypothetical protein MCQ_00494 [Bartonella washoeensis Sb944nv]
MESMSIISIISGGISFIISMISAGFVLYKNYKEQKEKRLGQKLQSYSVRRVNEETSPNTLQDINVCLELIIHNPTNQIIKINHIKIPEDHPFIFNGALYPNPTEGMSDSDKRESGIKITKKNNKHIDLVDPKLDPEHLGFFDLFSINATGKLVLWFDIYPEEPCTRKPIIIVVEHTSCNEPEETLETKFCLGFFRWTNEQNDIFNKTLSKEKYPYE